MLVEEIDVVGVYTNLVNQKNVLVGRLGAVEAEIRTLLPYVEFIKQIRLLEAHLQSPTQPSAFAIYESAIIDLAELRAQLVRARSERSILNNIVQFFCFPGGVKDLESHIVRNAQLVENLRCRLKLVGKLSLQQEYQRLDDHLNQLIERGFNPQATINKHKELTNEKYSLRQRLVRIEELLQRKAAQESYPYSRESIRIVRPKPVLLRPKKKQQTVFTESNFWSPLSRDLKSAEKIVVIVRPYLTVRRTNCYLEIFKTLLKRDVHISVVTRPSEQHDPGMCQQSSDVIQTLADLGVEIITVPLIHQKIVLIDAAISWEGSMNWLSHKDTAEHLRRLDERHLVAEVKESLDVYLDRQGSFSCQPMIVTTNISKLSSGMGTSIVHQEFANVSERDIEAILFDCPLQTSP